MRGQIADLIFCNCQWNYDGITASNLEFRGNIISSPIESEILFNLP